MSDSLQPHGLQHTRPPCPLPTPGVYPNSCPLSQWCHPTISSSVVPFSSCPQSSPASGCFKMRILVHMPKNTIHGHFTLLHTKYYFWLVRWSPLILSSSYSSYIWLFIHILSSSYIWLDLVSYNEKNVTEVMGVTFKMRLQKRLASLLYFLTHSFCGKLVIACYELPYRDGHVARKWGRPLAYSQKGNSPVNNLMSKLGRRPTSVKHTKETGVPDDHDCNNLRCPEVSRCSNR